MSSILLRATLLCNAFQAAITGHRTAAMFSGQGILASPCNALQASMEPSIVLNRNCGSNPLTEHSGLHAALNKLRKTLFRRNKHLIGNRIQRSVIRRKHHATAFKPSSLSKNNPRMRCSIVSKPFFDNSTSLNPAIPQLPAARGATDHPHSYSGDKSWSSQRRNDERPLRWSPRDAIGNHNRKRGLHDLMIGLLTKLLAAANAPCEQPHARH